MGLAINEALSNMLLRADSPSMRSFVRSILQGEQLGVSIGQILRNLALEMRSRRRQVAQERAQKAPIKMLFPLILLIFPATFVVLLAPAVFSFLDAFGGKDVEGGDGDGVCAGGACDRRAGGDRRRRRAHGECRGKLDDRPLRRLEGGGREHLRGAGRHPPAGAEADARPVAFVACIAALAGAAGLHPPASGSLGAAQTAGLAVAVAGTAWMLASVLALGSCFGILPEARGLVTRGPYPLIRHPLYLGEITVCTGLVLASPSVGNLLLGAIFGAGQLVRMHLEEAELTAAFPEYAAYAARTPRLLAWPRPRAAAASGDRLGASPGSA